MKFKSLIFSSAFALTVIASLAFKADTQANKAKAKFFVNASAWDPIYPWACDNLVITDDDCRQFNPGAQCMAFINDSEPEAPAYDYGSFASCTYPLYHEF